MNRFINQGHELLAQAGGLSGKGNKHATQGHMPLRFYELWDCKDSEASFDWHCLNQEEFEFLEQTWIVVVFVSKI